MPIRCRYVPNRTSPRVFTKADCVRVLCAFLSRTRVAGQGLPSTEGDSIGTLFEIGGAFDDFDRDLRAITAEVRARCGPPEPGRPATEEQASASAAISTLEIAEREAEANSGMLGNLVDLFNALSGILVALLAITRVPVLGPILRRFPVVSVLQLGAQRVLSRVEGFTGTILARKSANDAAWVIYRRQIEALKQAA